MLTLKLSDLFAHHTSATIEAKIKQYVSIMSHVDPLDPGFQTEFAHFFGLNRTDWAIKTVITGTGTWMDGHTRMEVFFQLFNGYMTMPKTAVSYDCIIDGLSVVPMKNGKGKIQVSFSSKILHTIYPDKPIIDQKMLLKLAIPFSCFTSPIKLKVIGKKKPVAHIGSGTKADAKEFYSDVVKYYSRLISFNETPINSPETYIGHGQFIDKGLGKNDTYFENFNTWLAEKSITSPISDVKKADFWMWLA